MVAVYPDRAALFQVGPKLRWKLEGNNISAPAVTQIGRALAELDIQLPFHRTVMVAM